MRTSLLIIFIVAAMTAIAATVLYCIFIQPEKKAAKMPKFIRVIRNILEMKELFLEKVLRILYIVSTLFCIIAGVYMFFGFDVGRYDQVTWYGGYGLLLMIGGPIVLRLVYEAMMMFVLLVKNTMQINNKMKAQEKTSDPTLDVPPPANDKPGVVIVQSHE